MFQCFQWTGLNRFSYDLSFLMKFSKECDLNSWHLCRIFSILPSDRLSTLIGIWVELTGSLEPLASDLVEPSYGDYKAGGKYDQGFISWLAFSLAGLNPKGHRSQMLSPQLLFSNVILLSFQTMNTSPGILYYFLWLPCPHLINGLIISPSTLIQFECAIYFLPGPKVRQHSKGSALSLFTLPN